MPLNPSFLALLEAKPRFTKKIGFIGDSLTDLVFNTETVNHYAYYNHWTELLRLHLGCNVLNVAVAGKTYESMLSDQLPSMLSWKPDYCFVGTEANDGFNKTTTATAVASIASIVTQLQSVGTVPVIFSVMPVWADNAAFTSSDQISALNAIVAAVKSYAKANNILYVDNFNDASFKINGSKNTDMYSVDGLHLSSKGTMRFAINALKALNKSININEYCSAYSLIDSISLKFPCLEYSSGSFAKEYSADTGIYFSEMSSPISNFSKGYFSSALSEFYSDSGITFNGEYSVENPVNYMTGEFVEYGVDYGINFLGLSSEITHVSSNGTFAGNIGVTVSCSTPSYVAGLTVTATDGTNTYTGTTNSSGYVLLPNVAPGTYTVSTKAPSGTTLAGTATATVSAGSTATAALTLNLAHTFIGIALLATGGGSGTWAQYTGKAENN